MVCNCLALENKPIWMLSSEEIDRLPKDHQQWAIDAKHEMREKGHLDMFRANPPNTVYESVFSKEGGWHLQPVKPIAPLPEGLCEEIRSALMASVEAKDAFANTDSWAQHGTAVLKASDLARATIKKIDQLRASRPTTLEKR